MKDPKKKLFGLILNGGLSRRMGSDKSKKMVSNKTLISLVVERAKAQVDYLAINSNQKSASKNTKDRYQDIGRAYNYDYQSQPQNG